MASSTCRAWAAALQHEGSWARWFKDALVKNGIEPYHVQSLFADSGVSLKVCAEVDRIKGVL